MTKTLRKAIIHRSKLKKKSITKSRQMILGQIIKNNMNLLRKTKNDYFKNLNMRDLSDNIILENNRAVFY